MYISLNPNFRISQLLSLLKPSSFTGYPWKVKFDDKVFSFSRGRWALAWLAQNLIRSKEKCNCVIFIPEYFCEISLTPLRNLNYEIHFYRITSEFEPEIEHLDFLVKKCGIPDILLYVHYFGFPSRIKIVGAWCEKNNILLVEDAAHTIVPIDGIGDNGYPTIYTPWKFFNIPEGAVLSLPAQEANLGELPNAFGREVLYPWGWIFKRSIHSLGIFLGLPLHRFRKIYVKEEDEREPLSYVKDPFCRSFYMKILARLESKIDKVAQIRGKNFRQIDEFLRDKDIPGQRLFSALPAKFGPYQYPLRIRNGRCRNIMISLNRKGIPALPWSDLSSEVLNSAEYPLANALRREILTLPVHQDLNEIQINWMVQELISELCNTR